MWRQGHAPHGLAGRFGRGHQVGAELVIVGVAAGVVVPEGDDDRTGQGGQVDHEFRLEAILAVPDRIRQNEAALRVRIDDFDGLAGHGGHHVAWTLGVSVGHVLDQAEDADRVDLRLAAGQHMHEAGDGAGSAHVPLHVLHAVGRLQRNAAGVEAHALAHEGYWLGRFIRRAIPLDDRQLAFAD